MKHSTATRSSQSQQVWNRVALAANNSATAPPPGTVPRPRIPASQPTTPQEKFPSLTSATSASGSGTPASQHSLAPSHRTSQRTTPWSTSSAQPSNLRAQPTPVSVSMSASRSSSKKNAPPPKLSNALFPELPTSSSARIKPQVSGNVSLKNILGASNAPPPAAWGTSSGHTEGGSDNAGDTEALAQGGKGKKGKGKQKQTLFTLGSFPN